MDRFIARSTTGMLTCYERIYTEVPTGSHGQSSSHGQSVEATTNQGRSRPVYHPEGICGHRLRTSREGRKALNMESQHGLRKGQYSSSLPVCFCILHLSISVAPLHF